jgi:hypothetical protein
MTTDIELRREDTGEIAVVRVIEPDAPVSAPYSRAVGRLERWVADERHAVDEFAAWIEGQAAQAHAEMRLLCDELGLPVAWAEVPEHVVLFDKTNPHDRIGRGMGPALRARYGTLDGQSPFVARRPTDVLGELYEQRTAVLAGPAPDENMPGRYRLTPRSQVQAGPRSRFGRWVDEQMQRPGRWWRAKKAATGERMGITDGKEN